RVDEGHLRVRAVHDPQDLVARGLRLVADDRELLAGQPIEEGALAHVGASDERGESTAVLRVGHVRLLEVIWTAPAAGRPRMRPSAVGVAVEERQRVARPFPSGRLRALPFSHDDGRTTSGAARRADKRSASGPAAQASVLMVSLLMTTSVLGRSPAPLGIVF